MIKGERSHNFNPHRTPAPTFARGLFWITPHFIMVDALLSWLSRLDVEFSIYQLILQTWTELRSAGLGSKFAFANAYLAVLLCGKQWNPFSRMQCPNLYGDSYNWLQDKPIVVSLAVIPPPSVFGRKGKGWIPSQGLIHRHKDFPESWNSSSSIFSAGSRLTFLESCGVLA